MLLYILCIYLSLYFNVHIIVVGLYCCVCFPRWVLDHLLGYVWEVPLGGRNPIPPTHLEILLLLFSFLSSHLLSSNLHPLLFYVIPFNFLHVPSPPLFYCTHIYIPIYIYTISRHLNNKKDFLPSLLHGF